MVYNKHMDNNTPANQLDQATPTPGPIAPTPNQNPKPKYTKIILVCLITAICLIIGVVVVLANVDMKPTTDANPVADTNSTSDIPSDPENPDPDPTDSVSNETPSTDAPASIDYVALGKTIIPARDDNGRIPDHVRGKADSNVIVVEYADFQCPGCASMMPRMSTVYAEYKDRVAFVFRNYPINGHQKAMPAAIAAESAGLQGYFWEMTEALYANRETWINTPDSGLNSVFLTIFKQVAPSGNTEKFTKDLTSTNIKKKIEFDRTLGSAAKLSGTPSIYVNGVLVDDFTTFDSFINTLKKTIEAELKK